MWPFRRKKEVAKPAVQARRPAASIYSSGAPRRDDGFEPHNPLNFMGPLSPLNPVYQNWDAPSSGSCDSHHHSSSFDSSSSGSYDSGSSSSYDGGSSSCSSD